ncbi:sensor histidine kinase [Ferrimonas aestuarii]|uniref:histidine kinase n=1 Tax=Ferrimonas aestuarii TaxID=2569539 RepID=A0A4U1BKB8_9GAMM|nr:HAMP domain-containing sensor histidine kinase [Ferrimonas aestuarii]TKB51673.1 HAMP domain-containing histidine kinase [Ferrimonas aestuarii]
MPLQPEPHWWDLRRASAIQRLLVLRTFILAALTLLLPLADLVDDQVGQFANLIPVISLMIAFHILSLMRYRHNRVISTRAMLIQVLSDLAFLTVILHFNGGATNAFVSLLLLPIVFAGVSLTVGYLVLVTLLAVIAYGYLLATMPEHAMHMMDMKQHFIFMGANFVISALVIALVVGAMAKMIAERERLMAKQREEQLRKEQLLALGTASAQVTHQLATPLSNLQLLFEELQENYPSDPAVTEMAEPLEQTAHHLGYFRTLATAIREGKHQPITISELAHTLSEAALLHFPNQQLSVAPIEEDATLIADAMLLPALLNLVQNAARANQQANQRQIELSSEVSGEMVTLRIRDHGTGIDVDKLKRLGAQLQRSQEGLGMALMLTNATFERLGGQLHLRNHVNAGAIAEVRLPIEKPADETAHY